MEEGRKLTAAGLALFLRLRTDKVDARSYQENDTTLAEEIDTDYWHNTGRYQN